MNDGVNGSAKMIVCPSCQKQITEQASIEIPTSDMEPVPSVRFDPSLGILGTTLGNIFYKKGKYFLVFETMCRCPHCHTYFELDIPIEFARPNESNE